MNPFKGFFKELIGVPAQFQSEEPLKDTARTFSFKSVEQQQGEKDKLTRNKKRKSKRRFLNGTNQILYQKFKREYSEIKMSY